MKSIKSGDYTLEEMLLYIEHTNLSSKAKEVTRELLEVILLSGENDITLDFEDLKVIMSNGGEVFGGTGKHDGKESAIKAINVAIKNSSLDYNFMDKISGVLVHFKIHPDFPMMNLAQAMEIIHENVNYDADVIWGTTTDETVRKYNVKATVLFTGFEGNVVANNIYRIV